MSKEIAKATPPNEESSISTSFKSSFNNVFQAAVSKHNTFNIYTTFNEQPYNSKTLVEAQEELINEEVVKEEVIKEEILQFVWKYLDIDEKFNCTLVCKRFNKFINEMDVFSLYLDERWSDKIALPIFNRRYRTLCIKDHKFGIKCLPMFKQLGPSLTNFALYRV
ncbi:unnamed protein product [Diamesa hyperborea]